MTKSAHFRTNGRAEEGGARNGRDADTGSWHVEMLSWHVCVCVCAVDSGRKEDIKSDTVRALSEEHAHQEQPGAMDVGRSRRANRSRWACRAHAGPSRYCPRLIVGGVDELLPLRRLRAVVQGAEVLAESALVGDEASLL